MERETAEAVTHGKTASPGNGAVADAKPSPWEKWLPTAIISTLVLAVNIQVAMFNTSLSNVSADLRGLREDNTRQDQLIGDANLKLVTEISGMRNDMQKQFHSVEIQLIRISENLAPRPPAPNRPR